MMIRTCPTCGDFYADDALAFCPGDGAPLTDVDPLGERWDEAARAVEEKERNLRTQRRRLRRRRFLMTMTSVMMVMTVICVVAVNGWIYLGPEPDRGPVANTLTPTPTPERDRPPDSALEPWPDSTPYPTPPPWPTPTPPRTPTPTPTPPRKAKCTAADQRALKDALVKKHDGTWQGVIRKEQDDILKTQVPRGAREPRVVLLTPIDYAVAFSKTCAPLSVKATYTWQVSWGDALTRREGGTRVVRMKHFDCEKDGAAWRCDRPAER